MSSWKNTGVCAKKPTENVRETVQSEAEKHIFPWPEISEEPELEKNDARFVKAFPLTFPCGEADLRQPRQRSDFTVADYVQHLFRYHTGHIIRSNRGQREVWALFNTALREHAFKQRNLLNHKKQKNIFTKEDLLTLIEEENNIVSQLSAFGADIPTTSMHWKRESSSLEWIVRQMSWIPPWSIKKKDAEPEAAKRMKNTVRERINECEKEDLRTTLQHLCVTPEDDDISQSNIDSAEEVLSIFSNFDVDEEILSVKDEDFSENESEEHSSSEMDLLCYPYKL